MGSSGTVARADELARVRSTLSSDRFSAVVLSGEAGIGKTTLWRAEVEDAERRGTLVLRARPTEAESRLSYAALADLLGPLLAEHLDAVPRPQARALQVALRLADPATHPVDPHSIAAGALGVVRSAARATTLVAVDDLQWLDRESSTVLEFVLRRSLDLDVHVLLSGRTTPERPLPALLRSELDVEQLLELRARPMTVDEIHSVLLARTGTVPPHPDLTRITEMSRGNPLLALELATRAPVGGTGAAGSPGDDLTRALTERHRQLPADTRLLLAAAAASSRPLVDVLDSAGFDDVLDTAQPAERAGIVEIRDGLVVFAHPLYAAVALDSCTAAERRVVHLRLAHVSADPEERARHLARAGHGQDPASADAAEVAALHARLRGAPDAASELAALAVERTSRSDEVSLRRRQLLLGELRATSGDSSGAVAVLEEAAEASDRDVRVRALLVLARVASRAGPSPESIAVAERAVAEAHGRPSEAGAWTELALLCSADPGVGLLHAQRAVALAERAEPADPAALARARFAVMDCQASLGEPLDDDLASRLPSPGSDRTEPRVVDRVGYRLGNVLLSYDDMPRTRAVLEASLATVEAEGDEGSRATVLDQLAQLEVVAGRWDLARAYAERQLDHALRGAQLKVRTAAWETLASIDVREGRDADARGRLDAALAWSRDVGDRWEEAYALRTLGLLHLSRDEDDAALAALSAVQRTCDDLGVVAPGVLRYHGDLLESLTRCGLTTEALGLSADLDRAGARSGSPLTRAAAARGRALALARQGDADAACAAAESACRWGLEAEAPFDRARSLLALGQIHRRRREKQRARDVLTQAALVFEVLGSAPWSRRTAEELTRLGLRTQTPRDLTRTEEAVAALTATGASNPEIAARLHMSRKTVEFHLTKVFRKLGVRSRTELAARWPDVGSAPSPVGPDHEV